MIYLLKNPELAAPVFGEWPEAILWSCLEGVMGAVYAKDLHQPQSAMAVLGDFCFLGGQPAAELLTDPSDGHRQKSKILIPQNEDWSALIEQVFSGRAKKVTRYALKKEKEVFDRKGLAAAVHNLSDEYRIAPVDEELFHLLRQQAWSRDLVSQFEDYEAYRRLGIGMAVLKDTIPVSGASSYARYRDGIEIEIDTVQEYRRQGLAYACGAALILSCLERGLYPSWDAQNVGSLALAEKLGYRYDCSYTAYEINDTQALQLDFRDTDGADPDFALLCVRLDETLDRLVGGSFDRKPYAQYNLREDIGDVIVAYHQNKPVACGGLKMYDEEHAELKRIYVDPAYQNQGIGGELVRRLEEKARAKGFGWCILETGEPLTAACRLYQKAGYQVIPNYGPYSELPDSVCMAHKI